MTSITLDHPDDGITVVTLDRPAKLNAMNVELITELHDALDDAVVHTLTTDQLHRVLRPKVHAAAYLHDLTRDLDLSAFVLFSSVAGVFGGAAIAYQVLE